MRKVFVVASLLAALASAASAGDLSLALHAEWSQLRAADFVRASAPLTPAIQAVCVASPAQAEAALQQARRYWLDSLIA